MKKRGRLITIEGGEGAGKTTHAGILKNYISDQDVSCECAREPGGVKAAEEIRVLLKDKKYDFPPLIELSGMETARILFYNQRVIPHLERGNWMVLDRSIDSTVAYQGYAGGIDIDTIQEINKIVTRGITPDLTFILDIDPEEGLKMEDETDRFGAKGLEYHKKVREGFLQIAKDNPERCVVIPYIKDNIQGMQNGMREYVDRLILGHS